MITIDESAEHTSCPEIYQISWVTYEDFDPNKISVLENNSSGVQERYKILYEYTPGAPKRDLVVTVPRIPEAYIKCRGVQKGVYSVRDTKVETNRYEAHFVLEGHNEYHCALYKMFEAISNKVKELTESEITFPAKDMDNYSIIYTNLIHAKDGRMFSSAYTSDEQLHILNCKQCVVRPAFLLSLLRKSKTEVKVRVQVSQMYVHKELKNFPLAHRD